MFSIELFSKRLKNARKDAGITQKELGEELGILQTAYSRFERGVHQLSYEQLYYVARRLGVSLNYLFGLDNY